MVTAVASMVQNFNVDNIKILKEKGFEVHVATNFLNGSEAPKKRILEFKRYLESINVKTHQIDVPRGIGTFKKNIRAIRQLNILMRDNDYLFMHCQSPLGSVLGRIAAHHNRVAIMYTAHGFQFLKGGPIKDWLFFYPVEKFLSLWTKCLVTINTQDYKIAKKHFFSKDIEYLPGVGIKTDEIANYQNSENIRKKLSIPSDSILILSAGELNENKNHILVIRALEKIKNDRIYYVICGQGSYKLRLLNAARKAGIDNKVIMLGYRDDLIDIIKQSNIFVFPSLREGLSVALMESLASGTLTIASNIRGNEDLIDGKNGILFDSNSVNDLCKKIDYAIGLSENTKKEIYDHQITDIKKFDRNIVNRKMSYIYDNMIQ